MLRIILLVLLVWQIWTALGKAEEEIVSSLSIEFQEKELVLRAQGIPLGNILDRIRHDCSVEIIGLEAKQNESITFSCKGESLKVLLKRLIWHLGEKNYAFEFVGERLIRAYVVPEAKGDVCAVPGQVNEKAIQNHWIGAGNVLFSRGCDGIGRTAPERGQPGFRLGNRGRQPGSARLSGNRLEDH